MTRTVGIYIFKDVEVLDFAGPYGVFSTASRVHQRSHPQEKIPYSVQLIAAESGAIEARGGMRILPDFRCSQCPRIDILIVPGGLVERELERDELLGWIRSLSQSAEIVASVCTGAFILAKAGLLEGLSATTHWEDIEEFSQLLPNVQAIKNKRWVEEGRILTSAGISAGIDMSLHIVSMLEGQDLADLTARQMDYRWHQNF
jgi:transcriptional regulator GlxA family with amidase domain